MRYVIVGSRISHGGLTHEGSGPTYYFTKSFPKILHENENKLDQGRAFLEPSSGSEDLSLSLGVLQNSQFIHSVKFSLQIFISINSSTNSTLSNSLEMFKMCTKRQLGYFINTFIFNRNYIKILVNTWQCKFPIS